jgi:hypothetical protein
LATLLRGRSIDQDPPVLALALRAWMALGGQGEVWLRLPGALAGAASAGVAGIWLTRRAGSRAGILLALLVALSPTQVYYARELNQYAFIPLLTLLLVILYERLIRADTRWTWIVFGLASMVALGTHYGLAFPLAILSLDLIRRARRVDAPSDAPIEMKGLRRYLLTMMAFTMLLAWLGLAERAMLSHLDPRVFGTSFFKEMDYLADRLWREVLVFQLLPFSGGPALWAVAALGMIALWGLLPEHWRVGLGPGFGSDFPNASSNASDRESEPETQTRAWSNQSPLEIGTLLFGLLLLSYPADLLGMYPLGNRWALFLSPFFLAALALGLDALWRESPFIGPAAGLSTAIIFIAFLPQMDALNPLFSLPREGTREVVEALETAFEDGDRVFVWHAAVPVFDYYASRTKRDVIHGRHPQVEPPDMMVDRVLAGAEADEGGLSGRRWLVLVRISELEQDALAAAFESRGWTMISTGFGDGATLVRLGRAYIIVP